MHKEIVEFKKEMGQYQDNVLKIGSLATATVSLYVWMLCGTEVPLYVAIFGHRGAKTCLRGCVNNNCADQPVHLRSLISAFVFPISESIISRFATSEILIF